MPFVSELELARVLQRDQRAVKLAVESGRITKRDDGLFDLETALQEWEATTHHEKGHNNRSARPANSPATIRSLPAEIPTPDIPTLKAEAKSTDYAKARAGTQIYEALLKKLRYEERAKNLTPTKDAEDAAYKEHRIIRDACFNIPTRVAAQLATETNVERCQQLLEAEMRSVFEAFADGKLS